MIGIDPATLWHSKLVPGCLPRIEASDLLSILVQDTNYYTAHHFKAFKRLEAYNQMFSGFYSHLARKLTASSAEGAASRPKAPQGLSTLANFK